MKTVSTDILNIAYHEYGPDNGQPVILLHGFPYDTNSYADVAAQLSGAGLRCIVPYLRGFGPTRFANDDKMRSGQQAAIGLDLIQLMDALSISNAVLGGYDWGGRAACIVAALWPERVTGLVSCGVGYNIQNIGVAGQPAGPEEESRYWYMYYFHTERGREALRASRDKFCRFLWDLWSPSWNADDATFGKTSPSFANPDFVDIVIHSYRHRFGGIAGDPELDWIEENLLAQPNITVPTVVLQGKDDGVDPPELEDHVRAFFLGSYERQIVNGTGHNVPQEAPDEFANAVLKLSARLD